MVTMSVRMQTYLRRITRQLQFVIVATTLAVVVAGCGANEDTSPNTTSTSVGTSIVPSVDDAILDGYRKSWADYLAVGQTTMDPDDPRLAAHATSRELEQVKSAFLAHRAANQKIQGTIDLAPRIVSKVDTEAVVSDCYFDHTRWHDAKTGEAKSAEDTQRQLVETTMQLESGIWKAASVAHKEQGCVVP